MPNALINSRSPNNTNFLQFFKAFVLKIFIVNTRVIHWLAYYHHKFGIRHLILLTVIILYTVFGGLMFNALENGHEKDEIKIIKRIMQETLRNLSLEVIRISESTDIEEQMKFQNVFFVIEKSYKTLLTVEGKYIGDTYRKSDDNSLQEIWDFQSAVFYSMTLYAAIGFGGISCSTTWGKIASIIYTAFGIPLTIVVLADIANLLLNSFTRIYNYFLNVYIPFRSLVYVSPCSFAILCSLSATQSMSIFHAPSKNNI
uniref:Potassium channel domain-containing protein n=1 Tax=Acrobeloides nanus TaxID=290746 RepID=A0A914D386_9BILA